MSDLPVITDTTDEKQIRAGKRLVSKRDHAELGDLRSLLQLPPGRRFIYRVLSQCGIYHDNFTPDALVMAKLAGERGIGLWLLRELDKIDPGMIIQLMREAAEQKKSDQAEIGASRATVTDQP